MGPRTRFMISESFWTAYGVCLASLEQGDFTIDVGNLEICFANASIEEKYTIIWTRLFPGASDSE